MIILPGLVFLHVPKTGGQWVAAKLRGLFGRFDGEYLAHTPISMLPEQHIGLPVITFVRHPISWWESWYRYHRQHPDCTADVVFNLIGYPHIDKPFQEFVPAVFEEIGRKAKRGCVRSGVMEELDIGPLSWMFRHICHYDPVSATEHTLAADFVGRQEHLAEDLIRATEQLGVYVSDATKAEWRKSPPLNKTKHKRVKWNPELSDLVMQKEREILPYV